MAFNQEVNSGNPHSGNGSGNPPGSPENDPTPVDFIRLPECVWLRVMSFLPLSDRYHMTLSCDLFRRLFFDPCLWRSVDLVCFLAAGTGTRVTLVLRPSHMQIAGQFSHLFRFVSLSVPSMDHPVHEDTARVLLAMAERSTLRGLKLTSDFATRQGRWEPGAFSRSGLGVVVDILKKVKSLRSLDLSEWPIFGGDDLHPEEVSIFHVLLSTDTCPHLQSLSIAKKIILGSDLEKRFRQTVVRLVCKFVHLRHLRVRQVLLSDLLLHELASPHRDQLQTLTVLVCEPEEEEAMEGGSDSSSTTHISDSSWSRLRSSCPDLELHVQAEVAHVPRVRWALKPHLPVVSLELTYCNLPPDLLSCMGQVHPSLRSLTCHVLPGHPYDLPLVQVVTSCTRLRHLVFHGKVHGSTILHLAAMERQWRTFQFRLKHIVMKDSETAADRELSVVGTAAAAAAAAAGKGAVRKWKGGRNKGEKLLEFCAAVSGFLGYPWKPCEL